ncbi:MAG: acyltransferase family protein [Candidatus Dadabacteria bacterium]|nr:MAG: acyltransferase family protein [Candidatus Dadabacteria bacterium]
MNKAVDTLDRLAALEQELFRTYARLGIRRTPLPPVDKTDPESVALHVEWIEKELAALERLLERRVRQNRPRSLGERLRSLNPSRLTGRAALLGLTEPAASVDPFGRDDRIYEQLRPWIQQLFEEYWRVEVEGLPNLPSDGAALMVANHGGLLPFDALMIRYAVQELHPAGRIPRFLLEDWFMRMPALNILLQRLGAVRGSRDNARKLLEKGDVVGLFPEGAKGVTKPWRDRYRVQRFGRGGAIRLALEAGVPIIPVAVVGNEETYPLLGKAPLPRNSDFNFFPITPLFPWLGPAGLMPLPSKWMIRFGEPIEMGDFPESAADDDILVNTLNEELRGRIQEMVNQLLQRRRSPWLG